MVEMIRLGARLRAARKAAGFKTSKEFLKKHKVPASTYSQHESGMRTPDDETLKFYSRVFEVNFNWLSTGSGTPFNKLTLAKNNIINEELLDLSESKNELIKIDPNLMAMILENLFSFNKLNLSKNLTSSIARDVAKIYIKLANNPINNKKNLLKAIKSAVTFQKKKTL